jgi:hypothetical protein
MTVTGGIYNRLVEALLAAATILLSTLFSADLSLADEGGVSFWIPGFYGSLAATPQQPGWSVAAVYYHANVSASGNAAISRAIEIGQFTLGSTSISMPISMDREILDF